MNGPNLALSHKKAAEMLRELSAVNAWQSREIVRLRAALTRLRDCDWTITIMDRMDAVRDIARAALNGSDERPHP